VPHTHPKLQGAGNMMQLLFTGWHVPWKLLMMVMMLLRLGVHWYPSPHEFSVSRLHTAPGPVAGAAVLLVGMPLGRHREMVTDNEPTEDSTVWHE